MQTRSLASLGVFLLACSEASGIDDARPATDASRTDVSPGTDATADARSTEDASASDALVTTDATTADATRDAGPTCSPATCTAPGSSCVEGRCVPDCRPPGANACGTGAVCDFVDGLCRESTSCTIAGPFGACGDGVLCGPGTECTFDGRCVPDGRCEGVTCDGARCYGVACRCDRPAPRCTVAPLPRLNAPDFVGAIPTNMRADEGIIDLEFDDICAAYAVTVISGQDHLRQLTSDGMFRSWGGASNLDMGEVALRRTANGTLGTELGELALTYACISGCTATSEDAQQGVARLDRMSAARPLPNVVPAMITRGTGPFGNVTIDSGPAGLAYGPDGRLYVGNLDANGEYHRVDLATRARTLLHRFPTRVHAATVFDSTTILVALENRELHLLRTEGMTPPTRWATVEGTVTSLARDRFTGRVYAELRAGTEPRIVEISRDGSRVTLFQRPARLGRIAIAPDNFLYHTAVYPDVQWTHAMMPPIQRWPLPATR
jgi:hypothetical protein